MFSDMTLKSLYIKCTKKLISTQIKTTLIVKIEMLSVFAAHFRNVYPPNKELLSYMCHKGRINFAQYILSLLA